MKPILFLSSLLAVGCVADNQLAPSYATVSFIPEEITLGANDSFNDTDLAGRLVMFNVLVTAQSERWTASYDLPLENVQIEVTSMYDGVYLLPQEAVELVSYPSLPADVTSVADVRDRCTDDFGYYSHEAGDWCAWYWDTENNSFYQFNDTYASAYQSIDDPDICGEENTPCEYWFGPTHLKSSTNERGILTVYALIDTLPLSEEVDIFATTGLQGEVMKILVASE